MQDVDYRRIAKDAADQAIRDFCKLLGVDIAEQDDINEFRADLVHARKMRKIWERGWGQAFKMFVGAVSGGTIVAMWDTIKSKLVG